MIDMFQCDGGFDQQTGNWANINSQESIEYSGANDNFQFALEQCGTESKSELAFRLLAENSLNMMRLSYTGRPNEWRKTMILGAMVAGHMDQEALNFIRYLIYLQ